MISGSGGEVHGGGTEFTAEGMEVVLREACEAAGLDPTGAELLRLGSNAVYRLASLPVIVRIARDPAVLAEMERAVVGLPGGWRRSTFRRRVSWPASLSPSPCADWW
ncbi:hypothetical protein [Streptomyces triticiradicis]|uniref:hypothetical protein n=1 Tax=Streptomyces triticiradicis TaxID=2651189 RepID=UPI00298DD3B7|nr:hypothetical protein [Streptomyces triticiradicis]